MTKEDIISTLSSSRINDEDKKIFLDILDGEGNVLSLDAKRNIINALHLMAKRYIDKAGITLDPSKDIEKQVEAIDEVFEKEIQEAEKHLRDLDFARRDLDVAYEKGKK